MFLERYDAREVRAGAVWDVVGVRSARLEWSVGRALVGSRDVLREEDSGGLGACSNAIIFFQSGSV